MADQNTPAPADLVEAVALARCKAKGGPDCFGLCAVCMDEAETAITAMQAYMASDGITDMDRAAADAVAPKASWAIDDYYFLLDAFAAHRRAAAITPQPDPRDAEIERLNRAGDGDVALIQAQAQEIERLREALAPFSAVADEYDDGENDDFEVWMDAGPVRAIRSTFKLSLYRRARAALAKSEPKP